MENEYQKWLGEKLAEKCIKNLRKHGFDAHFVNTTDEARAAILDMVSGYESFGFGGSSTTRKIGVLDELKDGGKTIYDHWEKGLSSDETLHIRQQQGRCDCFFCSANALSATGEIVNIDGAGNRVTAMTFGPKKVVIVAGINKLRLNLEAALQRIWEVAGPMRAKSMGKQTPCAETGICNDCNSPQRICKATVILYRKPSLIDISVFIVNQPLGF
jgi:L-lactate utilization protein LutB